MAGSVNPLNGSRALDTRALTQNIVAFFAIEGKHYDATLVSAEIERVFSVKDVFKPFRVDASEFALVGTIDAHRGAWGNSSK